MNNNTNDINWVLRWDHHPTKSVYFTKKYSGGNPHILMWGVGFQGLDDPPPKLQIPNTSLGNWEVDLNNVDSSYIIGIDFAREIWNRMIDAGWTQDFTHTPF